MIVIEDTRQQDGKHDELHRQFDELNITLCRQTMPAGDYMLPPAIVVDTKAGLQEICKNLCSKDHARVVREIKRANAQGTQLVFLIEEKNIHCIDDVAHWQNPRLRFEPKATTGETLAKVMRTMEEKYNCKFYFITPEKEALGIMWILSGKTPNER